jgi:hypothetical protein
VKVKGRSVAALGVGAVAVVLPLLPSVAPAKRSSAPFAFASRISLRATPPGLPADVALSDERTLSRWAYALRPVAARSAPNADAPVITRLHLLTENGDGEVYLLLRERLMPDGSVWVHLRIPARPVGQTGWVPRDALGPFRVVSTFLRIDRRSLRLTLFRAGKPVFTAPVAVGAEVTPTPGGRFWIREKFHTDGLPWYGPRALGTSAYAPGLSGWPNGGVIGVHGTDRPDLVPGRPSHGCIRLRNEDIERLYRQVPRGTPVQIV